MESSEENQREEAGDTGVQKTRKSIAKALSSLKGKHTGLRRIRVGHYRIIFEVQKSVLIVLVLRVDHRRYIYR